MHKMARIVKVFQALRNNWKKTVFGTAVLSYGIDFAETEFDKKLLVKKYCLEAVKYGDAPLEISKSPRRVVVLLNPAANKKKARKEYEKYCAPLLHLAGICVTVLTTDKNVNAIDIASKIPSDTDAVLIAGGDGMVSEVLTGVMRLRNELSRENLLPVGILPVGQTNTLANKLYSFEKDRKDKLYRTHVMMEATFSIIRELTKTINVMEIKNIDASNDAEPKPIYAVNGLQFGSFRDAHAIRDKFWYFGSFRTYATYLLKKFDRESPVKASITYTPPCAGCSKCYLNRNDVMIKRREEVKNKRWWHPFVPTFRRNLDASGKPVIDYTKITNVQCGKEEEISVNTVELDISQRELDNVARLHINFGPEKIELIDFIREGWLRASQKIEGKDIDHTGFDAQKLWLTPLDDKMNDQFFSIDNENFEVKKISVSLLHNVISIFYLPDSIFKLKS